LGLILDSSVLIAAERRMQPVSEMLAAVCAATGFDNIMISAISVTELEHGIWRADTVERTRYRRTYIDEVYAVIPVQPFTKEIGQLAARIDAEARKKGTVIPLADLQIGTTALHFGFALGTANTRHFQLIPNLIVKPL
jgi:tRNA(fMet)-specific endonuclease VapC